MHQFIKFLNAIYEHNYEETTMFNDGTLDKKKICSITQRLLSHLGPVHWVSFIHSFSLYPLFSHLYTLFHLFIDKGSPTFIHFLSLSLSRLLYHWGFLSYDFIHRFCRSISLIVTRLLFHSSFCPVPFHWIYLVYYFIHHLSCRISLIVSGLLSSFSDVSLPFYRSCSSLALLMFFSLSLCSCLAIIKSLHQ